MLCGFGNAVIKPLGFIDVAVCDREGLEFPLLFYVTDIIDLPILGEHACDLLNLVKRSISLTNLEVLLWIVSHTTLPLYLLVEVYIKRNIILP